MSGGSNANANKGQQYQGYGVYGAQAKHDKTSFSQFLKDEKKKDPWVYWGIIMPASVIATISTGGEAAGAEAAGGEAAVAGEGAAAGESSAAGESAAADEGAFHDANLEDEPRPDDEEAGGFHDAVQPMNDDEAWQSFNNFNRDLTRLEQEAGLTPVEEETSGFNAGRSTLQPRLALQRVAMPMARQYASLIATRINLLGAEYEQALIRSAIQYGVPQNFAGTIIRGCSSGIWLYAAYQISLSTYQDIHNVIVNAETIYHKITNLPKQHGLSQFYDA